MSGGLSPFKRPQLGTWLTRWIDEFDGIIAMRVDRLTHRALHFSHLHDWCRENGKRVICVSEGYDSENPQTYMKARTMAAFAEAELDAITNRIKDGVQDRRIHRSWDSGTPPMGYAIKSIPGRNRKILVRDPGYATYKGEAVEDDDGNPILIAENPFMSFEDWSDPVVRLEPQKREGKAWQRVSKHPLTGVALCGRCGSALGSTSVSPKHGRYHAYYRCSKRAKKGACDAKMNIWVSELEATFGEVFDAAFGDLEVMVACEGTDREFRDIWAEKDVQNRKAFLREHGVSVRVWQDLVPSAKYSAVIDFGDVAAMAKAAGFRLPDDRNRSVTHYRCGPDDISRAGGWPTPLTDHGRTDAGKRGLLGSVAPPRQG